MTEPATFAPPIEPILRDLLVYQDEMGASAAAFAYEESIAIADDGHVA